MFMAPTPLLASQSGSWVQDWVQVARRFAPSVLVSCAGSTMVLTATNQEVARSSRAGRTISLREMVCHSTSQSRRSSRAARTERVRVVLGAPSFTLANSCVSFGWQATRRLA